MDSRSELITARSPAKGARPLKCFTKGGLVNMYSGKFGCDNVVERQEKDG